MKGRLVFELEERAIREAKKYASFEEFKAKEPFLVKRAASLDCLKRVKLVAFNLNGKSSGLSNAGLRFIGSVVSDNELSRPEVNR